MGDFDGSIVDQPVGLRVPEGNEIGGLSDFIKDKIILFLRQIFSQNTERFRFSDNEKETRVMIVDKFSLNLESVEKKPALVVDRSEIRYRYHNLNQFVSGINRIGAKRFHDIFDATATIHCLSRKGLESERIADIVNSSMVFFKEQIRYKGFMDVRSALGVETPYKTDSDTEIMTVPVSISMIGERSWTVFPDPRDRLEGLNIIARDEIEDPVS